MTTIQDGVEEELRELIRERAYEWRAEPFRLTSGAESHHYVDGKQVTLDAMGLNLFARWILAKVEETGAEAVGGPVVGADPIVGAVAALSAQTLSVVHGFLVRNEPKKHGKQLLIEGPELQEDTYVILVDDVLTTGRSLLRAVETVRATGAVVMGVCVLVDREEGGREALEEEGVPVFAACSMKSILLARVSTQG
jgi:orotate phosphoribosyltransferase